MRRRIRRSMPEVRLEMTPLIDVMFLLVTYFVYALVLMVRADVIDLSLPSLGSGHPATGTAITIAIDGSGAIVLDGEPVSIDALAERVRSRQAESPHATLLLAFDTQGKMGAGLEVIDTLMGAGITRFSMVGKPSERDSSTSEVAPPQGQATTDGE